MTDEEMRVKIAEACGWKPVVRKTINGLPMFERDGKFAAVRVAPDDGAEWLPDYLNSLDAMAEAEKVLTDERREEYVDTLSISCGYYEEEDGHKIGNHAAALFATARQRALVFIATLNLNPPTP